MVFFSNTDTDDETISRGFCNSSQKAYPFVDEGAEVLESFMIPARQSISFHPLAPTLDNRIPMVFGLKSCDSANMGLNLAPLLCPIRPATDSTLSVLPHFQMTRLHK